MKLAVVSDIHAGLGENDPALRRLQKTALQRGVAFLDGQEVDHLSLNGDTTDHIGNALSGGTNREIAIELLAPVVTFSRERKSEAGMITSVNAGNTDEVIAHLELAQRQVFFEFTGFNPADIVLPSGGLVQTVEVGGGDVLIHIEHGNAQKLSQFGWADFPEDQSDVQHQADLHELLVHPTQEFLDVISSTSGQHRMDYYKALALGIAIKPIPFRFLRKIPAQVLGGIYTGQYERQYAAYLSWLAAEQQRKVMGIIGHTHCAGIREYEGTTILNTGTTGAKPNPLQWYSDPRAHLALINTEQRSFELIQTFNAARPSAKPERVGSGTF